MWNSSLAFGFCITTYVEDKVQSVVMAVPNDLIDSIMAACGYVQTVSS